MRDVLRLVATVLIALATLYTTVLHAALIDNLAAFWNLSETNGNRADSVGSETLVDNATVTSNPGIGGAGVAAQFTAANSEFLSKTDDATISTGDIDFTWQAWVYLDSKSSFQAFISQWDTGQQAYLLAYDNGTDRFKFYLAGNNLAADTFGSPSVSTWYCLHAWHNATTDTMGISVNTTADTGPEGGPTADSTISLLLGQVQSANYLGGRMQYVGLWKRDIGATDRTALYNSGAGLSYTGMMGAMAGVPNTMLLLGIGK